MATTSDIQSQETLYWKVMGGVQLDNGSFDIHLVQVADYQGAAQVDPPPRHRTVTRNQDVPRGTIVKVAETITLVTDRTITINPTS